MESKATGEFKLRITKALADQLLETLDELVPAALTADSLSDLVEARPGVYLLYLRGELVYVGKAASNLRTRLGNHRRKLSGRTGIEPLDVTFKCAYVDEDLDAAAPEKLLLKNYQTDGKIPWNNNGFGNKDQGRNRDQTVIKEGHFDTIFPINLDFEIELGKSDWILGELLAHIASQAPYTFRYEKDSEHAREVFSGTRLGLESSITIRSALEQALSSMPTGWQATVLPNTLILYPESLTYKSDLGWYLFLQRFHTDGTGDGVPLPEGMLTRDEIMTAAHSPERYQSVRDLMKTNVPTISSQADLFEDGLRILQQSGRRRLLLRTPFAAQLLKARRYMASHQSRMVGRQLDWQSRRSNLLDIAQIVGMDRPQRFVAFESEPFSQPHHCGVGHARCARLAAHGQQRHLAGVLQNVRCCDFQLRGELIELHEQQIRNGGHIHDLAPFCPRATVQIGAQDINHRSQDKSVQSDISHRSSTAELLSD
jgi:hypothetical protein